MPNINFNLLKEEVFDINAYIYETKNKINESMLLIKTGSSINGVFDDDVWSCKKYLLKTNFYIDFNKLEAFKFIGVSELEITLIKCWVAESLLEKTSFMKDTKEYISSVNASSNYNYLVDFIKVSNNFSEEFVDNEGGFCIEEYYNKMDVSDNAKRDKIRGVLSYLNFVNEKHSSYENMITDLYVSSLIIVYNNLNPEKTITFLPNSKDIFLYDHYVKDFFTSEDTPSDLKNIYYPIWIWWKVTNVIPMRISEFCVKIKRDCIPGEEDLYLYLDRIKKKNDTKAVLPLLKKFKIDRETYELIDEYINATKDYGSSETLISYKALQNFRDLAKKAHMDLYDLKYDNALDTKMDKEHFTLRVFDRLLNSFNKTIIKRYYNDSYIEEFVKPNDTRHFAFTSLMLQGISPEKIAIYGGHSTLDSLDQYTCSSNTYINTEVITIIRKNISEETINRTSLKRLVFNMPKVCPNTKKGFSIDFEGVELGTCPADFSGSTLPCESDDCTKCSKWWCSPTEESYNTLISIMMKRISGDVTKLERDINFIKKLFKESSKNPSLIKVDDEVFVEKQLENSLKSSSLRINARTRKIIDSKLRLIDDKTRDKLRTENKEALLETICLLQDTDNLIDSIREKGIIQKGDM